MTTPGPPGEGRDPARDPARAGPGRPGALDAARLAERLRAPGELTAAEVAALYRLDGGWPGPGDGPGDGPGHDPAHDDPGSYDADSGLPPDDETRVPEALEAGFTHRYGGTGTGFTAGGPLDGMLPGPGLAWHAGQARQAGLRVLSDDELIGVLGAARRLSSWQAELELAAAAELDARRAGPDGREGEHVAEEIAAALTLTGRSAGTLLELSRQLGRLPQTTALLAAGIIDRARAGVIAGHLSLLPDDAAAAVEDRIASRAGAMTTGQLAAACQRAVLACDPQAAARRKAKAEKDARVECWAEPAGTGAIAGRDLDLAAVIAADKHLDAAAGGYGAIDAATCRDLANALATHPATRWCLTLTDPHGRATAHGCARAGPGPPATTDPAAWLAQITITPIETGTCTHRRQTAAYRPPLSLRHLIKIRSRRCGYPGCRRPATRCDDDHTIPHHKGGKTCECNLYPLCRRHHQAKQAPGWRLDQPEPGLLTWTLPSGRSYATTPEPYPA